MTWEHAAREVGEALGGQASSPAMYANCTPDEWALWAIGRATTLRAEYAALVDELDRVNAELEASQVPWWKWW